MLRQGDISRSEMLGHGPRLIETKLYERKDEEHSMANKEALLRKLYAKPIPSNFTTRDLDSLMKKCGCKKFSGGRGSGIGYIHEKTKRIVQFDAPHPGNELYKYHIKMVRKFLEDVGEA